ncbi:ABC transporter ATP-binding protein [Paenibacillus mendelii]|uniref:ABC transporter ATP-binding protein n=1 Tax=Paenibacillus mendelii TaxID=206163 RepID=A0ABV6JAA8_9BACL|nr:ABC transporter ATP-binding protein [Paenibacillus mendelii]MCQ6560786.1 ABC transporter ATP-binding protein/permease [Paenibacillus mendelii]
MDDNKSTAPQEAKKLEPAPVPPLFGAGRGRGTAPKVRAKNTAATLKRIWSYLSIQKKGLISVFFLIALGACLTLTGPYLIGTAVDDYILKKDAGGLASLCVLLLAVYVTGSAVSWLQTYVMSGVAQRTVWEMRRDLFAHLQELPLRFFDRTTHGELMSKATNDIDNVSNTLNQSLMQLINSTFMLIGSFTLMLLLNVWLTLVALVTIPLVMLLAKQIAKRTKIYFRDQQQHLGELNGYIEETISGQKVVKIYNREQKSAEHFQAINDKLAKAGTKAQILSGTMGPIMNMMNHFSFIVLAVAGGWLAYRGFTTVGVIVSFLNYSRQFSGPVNELANQYNMIQSGIAGAERVFETIDTETEYTGSEGKQLTGMAAGKVVFEDVTFGYGDSPILSNISFTANPGDVIALVGPTGAGKTTIINLLTRFYEIEDGTITIDGQEIRSLDKNSLRSQLGIVLQDAYLFSDTIRENIRYGRLDATDEQIRAAAKLANADGFISKLPGGYDTVMSSEGGNLSHGQRQLVTIARAILASPAILILDEATSSVDTRTEMHIQEAMKTLMQGRTSFVIAHRLSTIRDADQILVVNEGRIMERGTHDQLIDAKGFYYNLVSKQFQSVG